MMATCAEDLEMYAPPKLQIRTFEQAALLLTGYAWIGNLGARDLLEVLFPERIKAKVAD